MLYRTLLLACVLSLTSCGYSPYTPTHSVDPETVLSHQAETSRISQAILGMTEKWTHDNHLRLQDSAYHWKGDWPVIRLDFVSQDSLEIGGARALLVDIVDDLMGKLNGDDIEIFDDQDDVQVPLNHFPYSSANLQVFINFESYHGVHIDPYYVGWLSLMDDMACFHAFNSQDNTRDRWSHRKELFGQSREFVQTVRSAKEVYATEHEEAKPEGHFGLDRYLTKHPPRTM